MRKALLVISILFSLIGSPYANYSQIVESFNEGVVAYNNKDYKTAFRKWSDINKEYEKDSIWLLDINDETKRVPGLDNRIQYELGSLYEKGLGTLKNYGKAAKLYMKSAKWNYPQAQLAVAKLMLDILENNLIEDIPKDKSKGYSEAAKFISELYENERATDEMRKEAEELWDKYKLYKYPFK